MREISRRGAPKSRRGAEMSRAEAIRSEMAAAVRLVGADASGADRQNEAAARMTGLPVTVVERLRWKKIRRVYADVADAVREAVADFDRRAEAKARHEQDLLRRRLEALAALADRPGDPDFYRAQVSHVVEQARQLGLLGGPVAEGPEGVE